MKRADVIHEITNLKGSDAHKWVVDTYNSIDPRPRGYKLQTKDPWCAATVSAILHKAGYDSLAECSCPIMVKKAKDLGIWIENDGYKPESGDIVMYDWGDNGEGDNLGVPDHVGIVVRVDGNKITVREGNKSNSVGNRIIYVNGKYIRGYIRPPYEADTASLTDELINNAPKKENSVKSLYEVGKIYTISVNTALNVRKGAGKQFGLVGYMGLTPDGKRYARGSALVNGTKVTCNEVKNVGDEIWLRIPSGWVCAKSGDRTFVK